MERHDYEALIDQIPAVTLLWDTHDRRFTHVSRQIEDLLGLPAAALLERPELWLEMIHPDDRARVQQRYERALTEAAPLDETYRMVTAGGETRWVRNHMGRVPGGGGRIRQAMVFDVTERAAAQAEHTLLIDQLPGALIRYDMEAGRLLYASAQLEQLLGEPIEPWMAPGGMERFAERIVEGRTPHPRWRELAAAGETWTNEVCWRRTDGRLVWLRLTTAATRDSSQVLQAVLQDATEEIEARRAREQLIEQLPAALVRSDLIRRAIIYASPQIEALTGEPAACWVGEQGYARFVSRIMDPSTPDWEQRGRDGAPWTNRYRWARTDAQQRVFRSVGLPVGAGIVQTLIFDATAEAAAEQALAVEQERYRTLVEQLPVVTFRNGPDGRMEYVSPQVERTLGYPPDEFRRLINDERWLELVHDDDRDRVGESIRAMADGRSSDEELELRMRTRSGEYRRVLTRRSHVRLADGSGYVQGMALDITDQREAEARSRSALAALLRAGEEQQARLAGELHDDTVQALTAVLIQLERTPMDEADRAVLLGMLRGTIERTRRLMFELRPQLLEMEGLGAMLRELTREGPWRAAAVEVDLRRQTDTVEALAYRTLRELILNARKHSRARRLEVRGRQHGGVLTFTVADDGVGFSPTEALRPHSTNLHMGLSSAIERVRLAGGEVTIDSGPGAGTRITVTLPAEPRD